jgi:hypothetical protein
MKTYSLPLRILLLVAAVTLVSSTAMTPVARAAQAAPTRIRFAVGTTSAVVSGSLDAGNRARYVLRGGVRQLLDVTLSAPEGTTLKVTRTNGQALTPIAGTSGATGFRGYLPYTGDYYLTVIASKAVSYSVNVFIPVRVSFAPGTTSDTVEGSLEAHQGLDYILRAGAGQVLEINVKPEITENTEGTDSTGGTESDENTPPDENAASDANSSGTEPNPAAPSPFQLIIYGVDGTVLRSGMGEGSSFRGLLPESQDYIVSVRAGEQAADFTMDIIIPQRIRFQTGAVSGTVFTNLPANHTQYYVLRAAQNQTMQVSLSPDSDLTLAVYGMDGAVLKGSADDNQASFSGKLPSSQDYILAVTAVGVRVAYRLRVTIK